MPEPGHILVVCTGNICRSPMAEGLLRHALAGQPGPLQSLKVISAGVATRPGEPVSENSVLALKKAGIDISGKRSRPLTQDLLTNALVVLGMTVLRRSGSARRKRDLADAETMIGGAAVFESSTAIEGDGGGIVVLHATGPATLQ